MSSKREIHEIRLNFPNRNPRTLPKLVPGKFYSLSRSAINIDPVRVSTGRIVSGLGIFQCNSGASSCEARFWRVLSARRACFSRPMDVPRSELHALIWVRCSSLIGGLFDVSERQILTRLLELCSSDLSKTGSNLAVRKTNSSRCCGSSSGAAGSPIRYVNTSIRVGQSEIVPGRLKTDTGTGVWKGASTHVPGRGRAPKLC